MSKMKIALFDMDHTLIDSDCDLTWKTFVVQEKLAIPNAIKQAEQFFEDYNRGCLDFSAFVRFQALEFKGRTVEEMQELCQRHFDDYIRSIIYPKAQECVRQLQKQGIPVALLTATNLTIAAPLAAYFGFDALMGTQLEIKNGRYTGEIDGIYGGGEGKVVLTKEYLDARGFAMEDAGYFGDSINDRFVLSAVGHPHAVNPSPELLELATNKNWQVMYFKDKSSIEAGQ